ncbi:Serine protease inhibitor Kazal-type 6 [Leptosomus discolor]|nr:Serine protease inhibitor Kazal-type 6 [Leptosomus discolor]
MKITGAFVLLTLAVLCLAKRWVQRKMTMYLQVDCSEYKTLERGRPIYCERLYQPFCGSDGKTYNNKCSFCKAIL